MQTNTAPDQADKPKLTKEERAEAKALKAAAQATAKAEREKAKLERQRKKEEKDAAKQERLEYRAAMKAYKEARSRHLQAKRRRHIPDKYPDWEQASVIAGYDLQKFSHRVDHDIYLQLREVLQSAAKFTDVLDFAANIIGCDRNEVCAVERAGFLVDGEYSKLILRCEFNPMVNDAIKSTELAVFDRNRKSWNFCNTKQDWDQLDKILSSFFKCIVDISTVSIYENSGELSVSARDLVAFSPRPYHEAVTLDDIKGAIAAARPRDADDFGRIYVHDGEQFLPWDSGIRWTQMPSLLIRYGMSAGNPRYLGYSVIARDVEFVTFGVHDKRSTAVLAMYRDACRVAGIPGFVLSIPGAENKEAL
jgi:hypothetical protein